MLSMVLQDFGGDVTSSGVDSAFGPIVAVVFGLILLGFIVFMIAASWKIFTKAGEPGWFSLIPILNTYTVIKIVGRPGWWLLLTFIPIVNVVVIVIVAVELATAFGKGVGFALGLLILSPIFIAILGWGPARYTRPQGPTPLGATPGALG